MGVEGAGPQFPFFFHCQKILQAVVVAALPEDLAVALAA